VSDIDCKDTCRCRCSYADAEHGIHGELSIHSGPQRTQFGLVIAVKAHLQALIFGQAVEDELEACEARHVMGTSGLLVLLLCCICSTSHATQCAQ
jgi:hypothetical protein